MNGSDKAIERRQGGAPDISMGPLELWIGTGEGQSWPWIDVAVRIGTGWEKVVDLHGPMLQRPDLLALAPAMRDFVEGRRNDLLLASLGGSMRLVLRRSEYGSLHAEAWFNRGRIDQTVSFGLWDEAIATSLPQVEETVQRLKEAQWGWKPSADWGRPPDPLLPRDTQLPEEAEEHRPPLGAWDAGLGTGADVAFEYLIDGYGWYSIDVRVGERTSGFGGGYLTDPMGDLLRAALALLAGAQRTELTCNAEPGITRVEFERLLLGVSDCGGGTRPRYGCKLTIRPIDHFTGEAQDPEFEALCRSPRAVAEAIYRMALPHFTDGAGPWSDPMAALEGALAAVPPAADA